MGARGSAGRLLATFPNAAGPTGHNGEKGHYLTLAMSPTGPHGSPVVFSGDDQGVGILWDFATGRELNRFEGKHRSIAVAVISRDGKHVVTGGGTDDPCIQIWDAASAKPLKTLMGHKGAIRSLALTPDGNLLSTGHDYMAILWNLDKGEIIRRFDGHKKWVKAAVQSRDGRTVYTAADGIRAWNVATGTMIRRFDVEGHDNNILALALSPNERHLASAAYAGIVCLHDTTTGKEVAALKSHRNWIWDVAFTPDGRYLLSAGGGAGNEKIGFQAGTDFAIRRWDLAQYASLSANLTPSDVAVRQDNRGMRGSPLQFIGHNGPISKLAIVTTTDGPQVLSCSGRPQGDHSIRLWDIAEGRLLILFLTGRAIRAKAKNRNTSPWPSRPRPRPWPLISPRGAPGRCLPATIRESASCGIWPRAGRLRRFERQGRLETPNKPPSIWGRTRGAFSPPSSPPTASAFITGGADAIICIWDLASAKPLKELHGHTEPIRSLVLTPDGNLLSAGRDFTMILWNLETGEIVRRFDHQGWIEVVVLSRDGKTAYTAADGIRAWDVDTGKMICHVAVKEGIRALALSPNEKHLAASLGRFLLVRLFDTSTGKEVATLESHRNWVCDLAFTPDGRYLLSAGGGERSDGKNFRAGDDFAIRRWGPEAIYLVSIPGKTVTLMEGRLSAFSCHRGVCALGVAKLPSRATQVTKIADFKRSSPRY